MLAAERDAKVQHLFHAGFPQLHIILPLLNLKNKTFVSSSLQFIPALSSASQDANCSSSSPQVRKR